jgi:ATP-binding cassette, subfamily B, bacterial
VLRGVLPALFAVSMGLLVGAVQRGNDMGAALACVGVVFILLQVLTPVHQALSSNLGDRTAAWLYDRLTEACVRRMPCAGSAMTDGSRYSCRTASLRSEWRI